MNSLFNKKIYPVLILWLVFLTILIKFGFFPFFNQLKDFSQRLIQQKKIQNSLEFRLRGFEEFSKDYSSYQAILNKIKNSFIAEPEVPIEFIKFLEVEAERSQIKLKISPLNTSTGENDLWPSIAFQVFLGGEFPNCLKFLEKLEQGPWLIEIFQLRTERVTEQTASREKDFGTLKPGDVYLNISLKVFSLNK